MKTAQEVRASMPATKEAIKKIEMQTQAFYDRIKAIEEEIDAAAKENKYSIWIKVADFNFDKIVSFLQENGYKIYTDSYLLSTILDPILNIKIYKVEVSWR